MSVFEQIPKNKIEKSDDGVFEIRELSDKEYIDLSKKVGDTYTSFVDKLAGKDTIINGDISELPKLLQDKFKNIILATQDYQERQESLLLSTGMGAKEILEQRFSQGENGELLNDESKYKLRRLSKGFFATIVEAELYNELFGAKQSRAQARAVKVKNGISFIILPEYKDEKYKEFTEKSLKENLPHEVNHLTWGNLRERGIFKSNEEDIDIKIAFQTFQEELLCRLCSNGALGSYSHLSLIDKEYLELFKKESPEKAESIFNTVRLLNDLLEEIEDSLRISALDKKIIILSVMEAENFGELKENLEKIKDIIDKSISGENKTKVVSTSGWSSL